MKCCKHYTDDWEAYKALQVHASTHIQFAVLVPYSLLQSASTVYGSLSNTTQLSVTVCKVLGIRHKPDSRCSCFTVHATASLPIYYSELHALHKGLTQVHRSTLLQVEFHDAIFIGTSSIAAGVLVLTVGFTPKPKYVTSSCKRCMSVRYKKPICNTICVLTCILTACDNLAT